MHSPKASVKLRSGKRRARDLRASFKVRYNSSITIRLQWNWQCPLQSRERLEGTAGLGVCAVKPAHNTSRRAMFDS